MLRLAKLLAAHNIAFDSQRTHKDVRRDCMLSGGRGQEGFVNDNVRRPLECRMFFPMAA
jgi:hypothetical protein